MRLIRGLWVGGILLLVLQGCSDDIGKVKGVGSYSPIIVGVSVDHEPAVRGLPNQMTAQITNVNGLPLTVHWRVSAGEMTDSTGLTATWTPPDSIGSHDVTISVEATDPAEGNRYYFKTQTYHVAVDNEYVRWSQGETVKYDPAPIAQGGLLFAQLRNSTTGESDVWRLDAPLAGPVKIVSDFWIANSPSPRADQAEVVFAGIRQQSDPAASIWLVNWGGGDATTARVVAAYGTQQLTLAHPRFAPEGTNALYTGDSLTLTLPKVWRRDVSNFSVPPERMLSSSIPTTRRYTSPNWGPDIDDDGFPDSLIVKRFGAGNTPIGLFKFGFTTTSGSEVEWLALSDSSAAEPDWSRDGQYVVFAKRNPSTGERDIWLIRSDTSDPINAIRVTSGPADDSHPRFSQDGTTIYFVSNRADRYGLNGIYLTERRGSNLWSVRLFDRP